MLQRIQSLFLLLVFVAALLLYVVPVYHSSTANLSLTSDGVPRSDGNKVEDYTVSQKSLLSLIDGSVALLSLVCIFLYRNRNLQLRIANVLLLILCIFTGLMYFWYDVLSDASKVTFGYGAYLPLIQLFMVFLASHYIRKDEELVRSADRLR
jgi:hypothetical protein